MRIFIFYQGRLNSGIHPAVEDDPETPLLGTLLFIDLVTGQQTRVPVGIFGRSSRGPFTEFISWSHDGRYLAASGWLSRKDSCIIVDVASRSVVAEFAIPREISEPSTQHSAPVVKGLAWSPVDDRLAVVSSQACLIYRVQTP